MHPNCSFRPLSPAQSGLVVVRPVALWAVVRVVALWVAGSLLLPGSALAGNNSFRDVGFDVVIEVAFAAGVLETPGSTNAGQRPESPSSVCDDEQLATCEFGAAASTSTASTSTASTSTASEALIDEALIDELLGTEDRGAPMCDPSAASVVALPFIPDSQGGKLEELPCEQWQFLLALVDAPQFKVLLGSSCNSEQSPGGNQSTADDVRDVVQYTAARYTGRGRQRPAILLSAREAASRFRSERRAGQEHRRAVYRPPLFF